jgi:hypothetical protein
METGALNRRNHGLLEASGSYNGFHLLFIERGANFHRNTRPGASLAGGSNGCCCGHI